MSTGISDVSRSPRWPAGFVVTLVLLTLVGGVVNALYSFGMLFATDSCGTSSPGGSSLVCDSAGWTLLVLLPWAGLAGCVLTAVIGGLRARRRHRSPWRAMLPGLGVYLGAAAVTCVAVFA